MSVPERQAIRVGLIAGAVLGALGLAGLAILSSESARARFAERMAALREEARRADAALCLGGKEPHEALRACKRLDGFNTWRRAELKLEVAKFEVLELAKEALANGDPELAWVALRTLPPGGVADELLAQARAQLQAFLHARCGARNREPCTEWRALLAAPREEGAGECGSYQLGCLAAREERLFNLAAAVSHLAARRVESARRAVDAAGEVDDPGIRAVRLLSGTRAAIDFWQHGETRSSTLSAQALLEMVGRCGMTFPMRTRIESQACKVLLSELLGDAKGCSDLAWPLSIALSEEQRHTVYARAYELGCGGIR